MVSSNGEVMVRYPHAPYFQPLVKALRTKDGKDKFLCLNQKLAAILRPKLGEPQSASPSRRQNFSMRRKKTSKAKKEVQTDGYQDSKDFYTLGNGYEQIEKLLIAIRK
jgi:hypothetical protein